MDFYGELKQEQHLYRLRTKPMRTILIVLALITNLANNVGAGEKKYSSKDCEGISKTIDYLLSLTPEFWDRLKETPNNDKVAIELSWVVDMAANYTTIYTSFCEDNE